MEISGLLTPTPPPPAKSASATVRRANANGGAPAASSSSASGAANLGAFQSIQQAMNNTPDTRADVVARGKALAASSTYPALEIITKLAEVFVNDAESALALD